MRLILLANQSTWPGDCAHATLRPLKELDGFTMPEIAEMLDVPLNTLYSRLRLARLRFSSTAQRLRGRGSER